MVPIRVVIADDEMLFRKCLLALIGAAPDMEVVGEAADAAEAVDEVRRLQPDVVVLDLMAPRMDGNRAIDAVKRECPAVKVLVFTHFDDDDKLFSALQSGAQGYILKEAAPDELLMAIHCLYNGHAYLHPSIACKALGRLNYRSHAALSPDPLTKRQREVLALVAQGFSNLEIGQQLVITEHTASKHVSTILGKLHLTHRVQAALYAVQEGQAQQDHRLDFQCTQDRPARVNRRAPARVNGTRSDSPFVWADTRPS